MRARERVLICILVNILSFGGLIAFIAAEANLTDLLYFGPSKDLVILKITIDTWSKYIGLIALTVVMKCLEVIVNDIGTPDLGFNIFDSSKTTVYGFTRYELQWMTACMWIITNLSNIFKILLIVSRLDLAIIGVLAGEMTSIFTVFCLTMDKRFIPSHDSQEAYNNDFNELDKEIVMMTNK